MPLFVLLLALSCSDNGVTAFNASPEALIISHEDGDRLEAGEAVLATGVLSDPDDAAASLTAAWAIDGQAVCAEAAADAEGFTDCAFTAGDAAFTLSLLGRDPGGAAATATVSLEVDAGGDGGEGGEGGDGGDGGGPPVAVVLSPSPGGVYTSDQPILFEGAVSDGEDPPEALSARWESDLDGPLEVAAAPGDGGAVQGEGMLTAGRHQIRLIVEDTDGEVGEDSVAITVDAPDDPPEDTPPRCEITAPEDDTQYELGQAVEVEAEVSDAEQPADSLLIQWSSDLDGALDESTADAHGVAWLTTSTLTSGEHRITLAVTDDADNACEDTVALAVLDPPGAALSFDGGDYATVEGSEAAHLTEAFTIEAWIRSSATGGDEVMFLSKHDRGYFNGWFLSLNSYDFEPPYAAAFYIDGARISGGAALNDGAWHHVAGVFDDGAAALYVDGALAAEGALPYVNTNSLRITLGQTDTAGCGSCFPGDIDEVRVWDVARSGADVAADAALHLAGDEDGLLMYWRLDEGKGQVFADEVGGYDGVLGATSGGEDADPTWIGDEPF